MKMNPYCGIPSFQKIIPLEERTVTIEEVEEKKDDEMEITMDQNTGTAWNDNKKKRKSTEDPRLTEAYNAMKYIISQPRREF
ncbi:hypothetical protein WH47_01701 [Habropoda laboriosa]|uniref:Uncharacterized protein n=1 Tax=Habropoda laboriosa TaxID=597456 RepID=A0A0L7QJT6_9HYME|nr:hypothetical protein WH47_01701 [Habropoda laboriosa]